MALLHPVQESLAFRAIEDKHRCNAFGPGLVEFKVIRTDADWGEIRLQACFENRLNDLCWDTADEDDKSRLLFWDRHLCCCSISDFGRLDVEIRNQAV